MAAKTDVEKPRFEKHVLCFLKKHVSSGFIGMFWKKFSLFVCVCVFLSCFWQSRLQKHMKHTLAYYNLLHFIIHKFFVFSFVLHPITL